MHCRSVWCSLPYLLLLHRIHVSCQLYTYAQPDSYAEFPQWHTGLVDFSFRASRADGLLFYLDSLNNGGDYLVLWLQDGLLKARMDASGGDAPLETEIGSHLNDLGLHSLRIRHDYREFVFYLDELPLESLSYDFDQQFDTRSNVFIGGLPDTYTADYEPAIEMAPLSGCIVNITFSDSISSLSLEPRPPITENELLDGCVDRCVVAECNGGECVTSWSAPNGYFCDCSEAAGVGESCTTGKPLL